MSRIRREDSLYCFAHIEKCGGTTLIRSLRKSFPLGHVDLIPVDASRDLACEQDFERAISLQPWSFSFAGHSIRAYLNFGNLGERMKLYMLFRNPTDRYISEYKYDCTVRGYQGSISDWMRHEERHNWMVKATAGVLSAEKAIDVVRDRVAFFGVVERYGEFMLGLRALFGARGFDPTYVWLNKAPCVARQEAFVATRQLVSAQERDRVRELNHLDWKLYEWVLRNLPKVTPLNAEVLKKNTLAVKEEAAVFLNRLQRNFWYKPRLGYCPGTRHAIPRNAGNIDEVSRRSE